MTLQLFFATPLFFCLGNSTKGSETKKLRAYHQRSISFSIAKYLGEKKEKKS